jgi:hypothetical protein
VVDATKDAYTVGDAVVVSSCNSCCAINYVKEALPEESTCCVLLFLFLVCCQLLLASTPAAYMYMLNLTFFSTIYLQDWGV